MNELTIRFRDADQRIGLGIQLDHTATLEQNVEKIVDSYRRFRRKIRDGSIIAIEFAGTVVKPVRDCENGSEEMLTTMMQLLDDINRWIIRNRPAVDEPREVVYDSNSN
jgi:hypothetical protein